MLVSIIIRTLNEDKYLDELLSAIDAQEKNGFLCEVIIVDSGSTDRTLEIAYKHNAKLTYINKKDFSFGRSLNIGCEFADGEHLVFVSGHCIPVNKDWLQNLVNPLIKNQSDYVYGRQIGRDTTKFSETQVFEKYFPDVLDDKGNIVGKTQSYKDLKNDLEEKIKTKDEELATQGYEV
ncbi:MAG: glycosyltransferase, partial [Gammaproteobacteria bacterium]